MAISLCMYACIAENFHFDDCTVCMYVCMCVVAVLFMMFVLLERALSFELLQFGDVLQQAIAELMPKFLCDYLKELAVKFTDFVTKCHVLNAAGLY
jgi:hypothetical protein